jgi:ferredoxin
MTDKRVHVSIDRRKCMGYGNCMAESPDFFDLDDEGIAVALLPDPDVSRTDEARKTARLCPAEAITVAELE